MCPAWWKGYHHRLAMLIDQFYLCRSLIPQRNREELLGSMNFCTTYEEMAGGKYNMNFFKKSCDLGIHIVGHNYYWVKAFSRIIIKKPQNGTPKLPWMEAPTDGILKQDVIIMGRNSYVKYRGIRFSTFPGIFYGERIWVPRNCEIFGPGLLLMMWRSCALTDWDNQVFRFSHSVL